MEPSDVPENTHRYLARVELPVSIDQAFAYHERPGCLKRLVPPWESVQVEHNDDSLSVGSRVVLKANVGGIPLRWHARHTAYDPPRLFEDVQDSGPFAAWLHRHQFSEISATQSRLTDDVRYRLPAGSVGDFLGGGKARRTVEAMFAYRHRVTRDDLSLMAKYPSEPLTIAVSGANGLVGSSLSNLLQLLGHRVLSITRDELGTQDSIAGWSDEGQFERFNEVDVVVHLAGKPIANGRWSESVKQQIRESRETKTRSLCERLAKLSNPPSTLICASATGMYGDRGEEILNETSKPGDDFLAGVCREWEAACDPARRAGIRVVHSRFGLVLSPQDGALAKMLTPAKLMGGSLGNGRQYWSWIALDDAIGALVHCILREEVVGPVNFVSPTPISNREFARTLGRVIGRPAIFPAPAFALRLALGEMADALLLASTRVIPDSLLSSDYEFRFSSLFEALRYLLGKERLTSQAS
ncbi:TIGR01777 family oxidoreductase [Neorhodopirellula pilleata]|uniref:Epimerase family protein n=1 Tax=Neorhodopirellula pilleata TaxID=2714738 RepID=A0A5C5ZNC6_9BACT|nr:TIGR01777 family oxidoreductase [Neorhodopirellula pilleata]TWT87943.1 Epimerase family protein [Neorhodopirellula pilleata]